MPELNKKQIAAMEEDYAALQKMEIAIKGNNNKTQKLMDKYSTMASIYTSETALQGLIDETESIIKGLALTAKERGMIMSEKVLTRYLDKTQKQAHKITTMSAIRKSNEKAFESRIDLYLTELQRESGLLKADMEVFIQRAVTAGFTKKEAVKQMVMAAYNKAGPVDGYAKRVKSLETSILRRESARAEVDAYKVAAKPGEKWQWITVSKNPCPDCQIRAGVVMSYDAWSQKGLPGEGRTVCGAYCMCKLMPLSIADEAFPEVKSFKWNEKSGVLTTAQEMRSFGAKGNQPQ